MWMWRQGSILHLLVAAALISSGSALGGGAVPRLSLSACLGLSSHLAGGDPSSTSWDTQPCRRGAAGLGVMAGRGGATVIARARKFSPVEDGPIAMVSAEVSRLKTSIDGAIMTAKAKKLHPMVDGSIAMVSSEVSRWKTRVRECNIVKVVDTFLGGAGIAVSMAGLAVIESKFAVKMFSPPMMASALIFFSPEHPPGPRNFFSGTLAGGTAGGAIFHLVTRAGMRPPVAAGLAVGALFMWFKATNTIFPPAAVLTALSAGAISQAGSSSLRALAKANSKFLVFPWAAGHACLYASAMAFGEVRTAAHSWLSLRELQTLPQKMKGMNLRDVFNTFDTSGDGHLDSMELKMALRKATGMDVSMNRVNAIIRAIDVNGDGFVCFDEFKTICGQ